MPGAVGILGYQGCIEPHEAMLGQLGVAPIRVRTADELSRVDRLILPGGESTTMLRFIDKYGIAPALKEFGRTRPLWGICAGAILAARTVVNPEQPSLNVIDIKAHRNFYGSQLDSFTTELRVGLLHGKTIEAQFIRAPLLTPLDASSGRAMVTVEASVRGQPVFLSQGKVWVSSFHVELRTDTSLHERFLEIA